MVGRLRSNSCSSRHCSAREKQWRTTFVWQRRQPTPKSNGDMVVSCCRVCLSRQPIGSPADEETFHARAPHSPRSPPVHSSPVENAYITPTQPLRNHQTLTFPRGAPPKSPARRRRGGGGGERQKWRWAAILSSGFRFAPARMATGTIDPTRLNSAGTAFDPSRWFLLLVPGFVSSLNSFPARPCRVDSPLRNQQQMTIFYDGRVCVCNATEMQVCRLFSFLSCGSETPFFFVIV